MQIEQSLELIFHKKFVTSQLKSDLHLELFDVLGKLCSLSHKIPYVKGFLIFLNKTSGKALDLA